MPGSHGPPLSVQTYAGTVAVLGVGLGAVVVVTEAPMVAWLSPGMAASYVLAMLLFGGEALHYFAVALTIGICFGIYSSVLVMAPLVRWLGVKREDLVKPIKERRDEAVV